MGTRYGQIHWLTSPLRGEVGANAPGEGFTLSAQAEKTSPLTLTLSPKGRGDASGLTSFVSQVRHVSISLR
ncbi:hypothetical protein VW35_03450 [Devosia soli]|uniref:Uncharacterized protein n=1 Tax=Devosia soli TaxID=361041 RepID=A0A0F5LI05_9HYPH|nr:hypothetical protein VW35_03450 [Devosia soli]